MSNTVEEAVYIHEFQSVIHIYKAVWNSVVGETLYLEFKEGNEPYV